ncbi:halocin C8-like domain-containing protein [Natronorubrum tibetense]|uniref:Uncharacterized protein n=1 Tax=Natronorubrum tibetense GA33 TaxID=1114856 RepID=L9VJX3_9EURY|nr:halocin C8-like domain-containing protein [Natronorubrum tibetense]ELY37429.1 hypothetical protein C496_20115 [Natronorubrum tibetense GA33]
MSDKNTDGVESVATTESPLDRRTLLKGISGSTVAFGASIGTSTVSAAQNDEPPVTEVDNGQARKAIGRARRSDAFKELKSYLRDAYDLIVPSRDARVFEAEGPEGTAYEVVSFYPKRRGQGSNENTQYSLAVTLRGSSVVSNKATIVSFDDGDIPTDATSISVREGDIEESEESVEINDPEDPETSAGHETTGAETASVTVQSTSCNLCRTIFDLACVVGCGVGAAALCLLAGVTTFGTGFIVCAGVTAAVCYFIQRFGCTPPSRTACTEMSYC